MARTLRLVQRAVIRIYPRPPRECVGLNPQAYYSFPVSHVTKSGDGDDLYVEGLATDGQLDHDQQVVDPVWARKAFAEFFATGPNIRAAHDPARPVGIGVDWRERPDGIWVKSLIVDEAAQRLVRKHVLRAYSVGISWPTVVPDPLAKGGRIASGSLSELSLVDRPSNARCGVTIAAKSAGTGRALYVGKAFGDSKAARKAAKKAGKLTEAELLVIGEAAAREALVTSWFINSSNSVLREMAEKGLADRG